MKCPQCYFTDDTPDDDVCRRCSRYLTRAEVIEVVLIGLVYLLLCRFCHYLLTGAFFAHPLSGGITLRLGWLSRAFLFPVNLAEHPWHAVSLGWTLALVVVVPALVAMGYGAVSGVVVAFVGSYHVPVPFFFVVMVAGAAIAGMRFRKRLPAEVMLLIGAGAPTVVLFLMMLGALLATPGVFAWLVWVVVLVPAAASVWGVPWLLRRRGYRARFLVWVVAAEVLVVLLLFHGTVGLAQMEYAFVRETHWAKGPRFRIVVASPWSSVERDAARRTFEERREEAIAAFTRFIRWFPRSVETPMARFELAEIYNLRPRFTGSRPDVLVPARRVRITPEALEQYGIIREEFGASPATVEARLRAARFFLQHSQAGEARLDAPLRRAERDLRSLYDYCNVKLRDYRPEGGKPVLGRWRTHRLTDEERKRLLYDVRGEALAVIRFIERNSDHNRVPLMLFCQLDPLAGEEYRRRLEEIRDWFGEARIADDVDLALLRLGGFKLKALEACVTKYRERFAEDLAEWDTGAEMLLVLGKRYQERKRPQDAKKALQELRKTFPDTPEAAEAARMMEAQP